MKITELKDEIETVALTQCSSFIMNWANLIDASTTNQYDVFLLTPPKKAKTIQPQNPNSKWELLFYIFRNNNDGNGQLCSDDERDTIWQELEVKAETIINDLFDRDRLMTKFSKIKMFPKTDLEIVYDENGIGTDMLIYVQCKIALQTLNDC